MTRRIAVVTGSRADFGLLSRVIAGLASAPDVDCQVIVTGSHLSAAQGDTVSELEALNLPIAARVDLGITGDDVGATLRGMGKALGGFAEAYDVLRPELIVLLGDRYEILAAATAATIACIPVAHLHGGEISEGAVDDAIRHAITKMAHLHFVAAEPYRRRVIQMGEDPARVFLVGGMGVDLARHTPRMSRAELEQDTGFRFGVHNLLVTYHPVTLDAARGNVELEALLAALAALTHVHLLFTLPNADVGNARIRERIETFAAAHPAAWAFSSLGFRRYLSFVAECDGVVGNSSSGLIEAPALGVGTVNVGHRQDGRLRASSVIDCEATMTGVGAALERLLSLPFRESLSTLVNPYATGGGAAQVVRVLSDVNVDGLLLKRFHDLPDTVLMSHTDA